MGLGGSIASTVKNKISGYGGNLVSNVAGAAKSPKRTGSVNHDVEGLIEESKYIKGDKVLYYPLDIGTDANGHYLQFFIRKQANLKMSFKGNDGKELGEGDDKKEVTKEVEALNLTPAIDKNGNSIMIVGKEKKTNISVDDDNIKNAISGLNLTNPKSKGAYRWKWGGSGKFLVGVSDDGKLMTVSGEYRSFDPSKSDSKIIKWTNNSGKEASAKLNSNYKNYKVAKDASYYKKQVLIDKKEINNYETPENEVKVGITNKYPSLRMESSIALFLPGGLKNETKPEWGETGTRIGYEAQAMLAAASGDLQGAISGGGRAAEMAMKEKVIPNLMDRAGAKYGMAYTDRMQVFFKNMGKRSFSYTFKFMPKSRAESIRVDDIVKMFRFYGSPSYLNSKSVQGNNEGMGTGGTERGQSGGWSIMRQPQIFEIVYMYKDKRNEYLNRISHCVLDSVSVTYNGDNNKFFNPSDDKKSGSPAPVETQIDLSFKEIEIITKDKIDQGF